jgi:membrane protease YdiL (CAAX protease family)
MTLRRALILIALQILLVFIIGFRILGPLVLADADNPFVPTLPVFAFVIALAAIGAIGLVWFGSVKQPRRTWAELGWTFDDPAKQIAVGVVAGLACLAGEIVALLALGMSPSEIGAAIAEPSVAARLLFLVIGVQAAFIEESLFRGNLFDALRTKMSATAAIFLGAVIFALYHLNPNPIGLVVKVWFGVVFTIARLRGGSLVSPAIAHALTWLVLGAL